VELTMTPDPLAAVLDQLAAVREHLGALETREAGHFAELHGQIAQLAGMIGTVSRALADDTAALAKLDALDRQVTDLTRRLPGFAEGDGEEGDKGDDQGYRPRPVPTWWKLTADERQAPLAELMNWAERVYRPGYGHLAATLAPCWTQHDLCLYGLDIASQLWCALYLQPKRTTGLLSAQAEYQLRILPAIATQLAAETTRCGHPAPGRGARRD
jgi:hypothetical protein